MIEPIITEKTLSEAKKGRYTFKISVKLRKDQIKKMINELFDVHVVSIKTAVYKSRTAMTLMRKKRSIKSYKKAVVSLKNKEKIDLFEVKEK